MEYILDGLAFPGMVDTGLQGDVGVVDGPVYSLDDLGQGGKQIAGRGQQSKTVPADLRHELIGVESLQGAGYETQQPVSGRNAMGYVIDIEIGDVQIDGSKVGLGTAGTAQDGFVPGLLVEGMEPH